MVRQSPVCDIINHNAVTGMGGGWSSRPRPLRRNYERYLTCLWLLLRNSCPTMHLFWFGLLLLFIHFLYCAQRNLVPRCTTRRLPHEKQIQLFDFFEGMNKQKTHTYQKLNVVYTTGVKHKSLKEKQTAYQQMQVATLQVLKSPRRCA